MKNLPDDIFRRKLEHLQTPPPPRAWEQIEKGMRRKRITPWLAIAASLLLVITASAVILTRQSRPEPDGIADRQLPETRTTPDAPTNSEAIPPTKSNADVPATHEPTPEAKSVPAVPDVNSNIPRDAVASNVKQQETAPSLEEDQEKHMTVDAVSITDETFSTQVAAVSEEENTAPMKIVLEADEVQARYLKRKTNADATESVAKASGLRKLLEKADQIQNQDPIGDLRQMKNELFALNFPGKKRDQHK